MKKQPFYFEIKNLITQFLAAFNDVAIKRYDADRNSDNTLTRVNILYSPKQRVIEDVINTSRTISLPAIAVNITTIARDTERVFNKIDGHLITTSKTEDALRYIPQPVPVNISVGMSIIARYQQDIEQILSNFIPYCDPYIVVSWKMPTTENTSYERELRTIIEWSGNINMQYPIELNSNQLARVTADTNFTIKGWLFKQIDNNVAKIYEIKHNYFSTTAESDCFIYNPDTETLEELKVNSETKDLLTQKARPHIKNIDYVTYHIGNTDTSFEYNLYGKDFFDITDMYIAVEDVDLAPGVVFHEPFKDTKFSSLYPGFYGTKITTFKVVSNNSIIFTIPFSILKEGIIDIIIKNEAGYSRMTTDSLLPPHSASVVAKIQTPYQPLCVEGIRVINS